MKELFVVTRHNGKKVVSAKAVHAKLEVKTRFDIWFSRRVQEYGFIDGKDFCSIVIESTGGRPSTDYAISLDMGKELGMLEGNEIGKEIRKYFIELEKSAQPDFTKISSIEDHTKREIQILNSKEVNTYNYEQGGKQYMLQYNINNCLWHTGLTPKQIRERFKNSKFTVAIKKNAKEIIRRVDPISACSMSLTDSMVKMGKDHKKAAEISNKHGREIFKFMLDSGIKPAELSF
jgi:phage anti-repressor protein